MNEQQLQFLLEEYKSLKSEIEYRVKATERIEYVAIVAVAAIYAWITQRTTPVSEFVWWIPFLFPVIGIIRQFGLIIRLMDIAEYILKIEKEICLERPKGWEHFLKIKRVYNFSAVIISTSSFIIWLLLFLVTFVIGMKGGFNL